MTSMVIEAPALEAPKELVRLDEKASEDVIELNELARPCVELVDVLVVVLLGIASPVLGVAS